MNEFGGDNYLHFISFNGSKFDNFLMTNALIEMDRLKNVSIVNNQIFNFKINGYESTLDLAKLFPAMRLKTLTESFGCLLKK